MEHPYYKLGKGTPLVDSRTIQFDDLVKAARIPDSYDVDTQFSQAPPMSIFGNDTLGDCVMAARANSELRLREKDTNVYPPITTQDVETEYFKETGGKDTGLVILSSLKEWKATGWAAGGQNLTISAYAQINQKSHVSLCAAIYSDVGVQIGLNLPLSAQAQIDAGKPWTIAKGPNSKPGSWGGHCVLVTAYDQNEFTCVTWGQKQILTFKWLEKYCDEAWGVWDQITSAKKSIVDSAALASAVSAIK